MGLLRRCMRDWGFICVWDGGVGVGLDDGWARCAVAHACVVEAHGHMVAILALAAVVLSGASTPTNHHGQTGRFDYLRHSNDSLLSP